MLPLLKYKALLEKVLNLNTIESIAWPDIGETELEAICVVA